MSFSLDAKNELANLSLDSKNLMLSELAALMRTNATISISFKDEVMLRFATENSSTARRIFKIIKNLYGHESEIRVVKNDQLRRRNLYKVYIMDEDIARFILEDTGFNFNFLAIDSMDGSDGAFVPSNQMEKCAFLRGAFLGAGSVTDPNKSYHLDIILNTKSTADNLMNICSDLGLKAGLTNRRDKSVLYLKDSEQISDFLSLIGAKTAMLELENIKVLKDLRNNVNRLVNCDTANIGKIITASLNQIKAIEYIDDMVGLDKLPDSLKEIALLRLKYPNDSLKDLGQKLEKPLGKSGVNHRIKKIISYSEKIRLNAEAKS
ncbi:MAG: DNA-binding protein WhiA [Tissierellia bacterium]|nr:DNA-binding protein WhiA [Tissierellia bacterium]